MTDTIEPGDIVRRPEFPPGLFYRVYQIQGGVGSFYRVTKSGRRDRRETAFSGSVAGWELVRKCEFYTGDRCQKCGTQSHALINGRCAACKPFRACRVQGCLGDLEINPTPDWMNRWVCNKCGIAVSR